jgi:hypothetical protein
METAGWLEEAGWSEADITSIWKRKIVTPAGGASLMLRLTLLVAELGVVGDCMDIGPPPQAMMANERKIANERSGTVLGIKPSKRGAGNLPECGRGLGEAYLRRF